MLTLFQAEWCPYSHLVRQRLTELGVDFVAKQVAAYPEDREELVAATGSDQIPTLVAEDGTLVTETQRILRYLDERFDDGPQAPLHREQLRAHRR